MNCTDVYLSFSFQVPSHLSNSLRVQTAASGEEASGDVAAASPFMGLNPNANAFSPDYYQAPYTVTVDQYGNHLQYNEQVGLHVVGHYGMEENVSPDSASPAHNSEYYMPTNYYYYYY